MCINLLAPLKRKLLTHLPSIMAARQSSDMAKFRETLKNAKNIVFLSGAGISAESGIPTFRGAGGMWRKYRAASLATPEAFGTTPALVWEFYHYRREVAAKAQPNAGHKAIAEYEAKHTDKTITVITQNVDGLHARAGTKNLIELHGNLYKTRCTKCKEVLVNVDSPICKALENRGAPDVQQVGSDIPVRDLPHCKKPECRGLLRPHIVWFGESLESAVLEKADKGILPPESKETADILLFFDNLFDSVNGSFGKKKKYGKPLLAAATPWSQHHQVWKDSKKILKDMKFVNKITNNTEYVPVLKNWVWTLEGIELLLTKLKIKYDVTSVWLRHLNQDPIENFFGSIRSHGCRNVNPTAEHFESTFATLLINSISNVHSPGANCEIDDCIALHETIVTGYSGDRPVEPVTNTFRIPEITITALKDKNDPRIIGSLQYVVGYFVKCVKSKVFKGCDQCKKDLLSEDEAEYVKYREYANKKWLHSPSDSLLCCMSDIQEVNYELRKTNLDKPNLNEFIKTFILMYVNFDFINCNVHKEELVDHLINISSRFFIYNYCKDINKILARHKKCDDKTDFFKYNAESYSRKMLKRKIN